MMIETVNSFRFGKNFIVAVLSSRAWTAFCSSTFMMNRWVIPSSMTVWCWDSIVAVSTVWFSQTSIWNRVSCLWNFKRFHFYLSPLKLSNPNELNDFHNIVINVRVRFNVILKNIPLKGNEQYDFNIPLVKYRW